MSASMSAATSAPAEAPADPRSTHRRGLMLIIASPSGAGKTTLSRLLLQTEKGITMSVSVTTRPRRASEVDGVHYHFLSKRDFETTRDRGDLLEWAEVHGNFYGTPRAPVEAALSAGGDVLFDIDVQGTLQLYDKARADIVSVFILPPSVKEMQSRLQRRAEDDAGTIMKRLATAKRELPRWVDFDYVIVNDDLDRAFGELQAILLAERLRRARRPVLTLVVDRLDQELAGVLGG
jgi:guanylate kinase